MARKKAGLLERFAYGATSWAGSSWAFAVALGTILLWAVSGPFFGFSDTWQLVINTSTTIVTFLMVFLIQRSQNKDAQAIQLKLNELVAAVQGASNRLINVEDFSEQEVQALHRHYAKLVELAKGEQELTASHSIEEARSRHHSKQHPRRPAESPQAAKGGPGQAPPAGTPGANGSFRDYARSEKNTPQPALGDGRPKSEETAEAAGGAGVPPSQEPPEPDTEEAEVAQFLGAAEKLRARIRWHQQQIAEHQGCVAAVKEVLARHGLRLKPLLQASEGLQGGRGPAAGGDAQGVSPSG